MLKKIFRKPSREQPVIVPTLPDHLGRVSEDDDYLVVGQTAIERTTVLPENQGSTFYVDLPPDYKSVVSEIMGNSASQVNQSSRTATPIVVQPTTEAMNNLNVDPAKCANSSPSSPWQSSHWQQPTNNGTARLQPAASPHTPNRSPQISPRVPEMLVPPVDGMAMLSGVPFKLSLALDRDTISKFSGYNALITEPLIDKYNYNFDLERSVKNS